MLMQETGMLGTQAEHRCAGKEQQRSQSRKLCSSSGLYGDKSWEMEVWVKSQTVLDAMIRNLASILEPMSSR